MTETPVMTENPLLAVVNVTETPSFQAPASTTPIVESDARVAQVSETHAVASVVSHVTEPPAPVAPVAPITTPEIKATTAPTVVPSPIALEAIGLQMVETDPVQRASVATASAEKPVRKPRTPRVKPVIVEEPLQMVETRKD
jgi:hypothetical protein